MRDDKIESEFKREEWTKPVLLNLDIKETKSGGNPLECEDEFGGPGSDPCDDE